METFEIIQYLIDEWPLDREANTRYLEQIAVKLKSLQKELAEVKHNYQYLKNKAQEIVGTIDMYLTKGGE